MLIGELRRLLVDLNIPDNTNICHVYGDNSKSKIDAWLIEKSHSKEEYELTLVTFPAKEKKPQPPPFKNY